MGDTYNDLNLFPEPDGVWIVRSSILGSVLSIHKTEIEALRKANAEGKGRVEFIPYGKTLVDLDRSRNIDCSGRNDA